MSKPFTIPADVMPLVAQINDDQFNEMIDPMLGGLESPRYRLGLLPAVYEKFALDQCHLWGGNIELYAGAFLIACSSQLHGSVRVRLNASDPNSDTGILGLGMFVANSGTGKTGVQDAICRLINERESAAFVRQQAEAERNGKDPGKLRHHLITSATFERMLHQQAINKGDPLLFAPGEASALLDGMTNHLTNPYPQLADLLNQAFDNGPISLVKQKHGESDLHAENVYFNVLTSTTPARLGQWKHKETAQRDGLLGRFDMICGSANHNFARDASKHDPTAYPNWHAAVLKLRELQHVVFVLDPTLKDQWTRWVAKKKHEALAVESQSPGVAAWLLKAEKRMMRIAATYQALAYIEDSVSEKVFEGKYGVETHVTITPETMRRAVDFHDTFLFNQQRYFHDHLMAGNEFASMAQHLFYRLIANGTTRLSREDFWGSKCLPTSLRSKDQWQREKFAGYVLGHGWLKPAPGAQKRGGNSEVHTSQFDVVDGFHEKFAVYKAAATEYWTKMNEWKETSDW